MTEQEFIQEVDLIISDWARGIIDERKAFLEVKSFFEELTS